jgi:GT2 family glycosyltransferase
MRLESVDKGPLQGGRGTTLVSVIVPTLDGARLLEESLPSLTSQTYSAVEIIVVDNASRDNTKEVADRFHVRYLKLDQNYGFAPAINRGVDAATGDILVFVNNDMRFRETFVEHLVRPILDGRAFATDARQLSWDGGTELHGASQLRRIPATAISSNALLPMLDARQSHVDSEAIVFQACGGNMAVDRRRFELLGRFDDRLIAGWEDTDLAWKAWARGWQTHFVPTAVCWHRVGVTSDSAEGARVRLRGSLGGRLLFATKYLPIEHVAATWGHAIAGLIRSIVQEGWNSSAPRARVFFEFACMVPALLHERRVFYRGLRRGSRHQLRLMCRIAQPPER